MFSFYEVKGFSIVKITNRVFPKNIIYLFNQNFAMKRKILAFLVFKIFFKCFQVLIKQKSFANNYTVYVYKN